jgi:hypothetical protein
VASKVLLTVGEGLILLAKVAEVAVTLYDFLSRRSLLVSLHLSECLLAVLGLFIGSDLAYVLLIFI